VAVDYDCQPAATVCYLIINIHMTKYINSPKDTICKLKWDWPVIAFPQNEIRMCCKSPPRVLTDADLGNDFTLVNPPEEKLRRLQMLQGIRPTGCRQCWVVEDAGGTSTRRADTAVSDFISIHGNELLTEFGTTDLAEVAKKVNINSEILNSRAPNLFQIGINNLCDLQCLYCYPKNSSQWAVDELKSKNITIEKFDLYRGKHTNAQFVDKVFGWVNTEGKYSLTCVSVIGGEPTINPDFYVYMDKLEAAWAGGPVLTAELSILTNLNTPDKQFDKFMERIDSLSKIFKIVIAVSIDATEKQGEYIRANLSWDRLTHNMDLLLKNTNIFRVDLMPAVTNLSVPGLLTYMKWHYELSTKYSRVLRIQENSVVDPQHMSPYILPKYYAKYVSDAIDFLLSHTYVDKENIASYVQFLQNLHAGISRDKEVWPRVQADFVEMIDKFDQKSLNKFKYVFPELIQFYNNCKLVWLQLSA
jgi:organic radical activating enzyme